MMIVWSLPGGDYHPIVLPIFTKFYLAYRVQRRQRPGSCVSYTICIQFAALFRRRMHRPGQTYERPGEHKNETWRCHFAYHRLISRSLWRLHPSDCAGRESNVFVCIAMRLPANSCGRPRRYFDRHELGPNRGPAQLSRARGPETAARSGGLDYTKARSHFPNPIAPLPAAEPAGAGPEQYAADRAADAGWQALSLHE